MNQISISGCMLLIGLLCCVHGAAPRPFGWMRGEDIMGRTTAAPDNITRVVFPVGKDPDSAAQTVEE